MRIETYVDGVYTPHERLCEVEIEDAALLEYLARIRSRLEGRA